jgi:hypothetical protein
MRRESLRSAWPTDHPVSCITRRTGRLGQVLTKPVTDDRLCEMTALPARISINRPAYSLTVHPTLPTIAMQPFHCSGRKSDRRIRAASSLVGRWSVGLHISHICAALELGTWPGLKEAEGQERFDQLWRDVHTAQAPALQATSKAHRRSDLAWPISDLFHGGYFPLSRLGADVAPRGP